MLFCVKGDVSEKYIIPNRLNLIVIVFNISKDGILYQLSCETILYWVSFSITDASKTSPSVAICVIGAFLPAGSLRIVVIDVK